MPDAEPLEIEFPPVSPENLVRLAEDFLQVCSTLLRLEPWYGAAATNREYILSISGLMSRNATSKRSLSSADVPALAETFHQAVSSLTSRSPLYLPWCRSFRLYIHALLLESQIFPNAELYDESPNYTPRGLADVWRGNYHGEPVCIKAIRMQDKIRLKEIKRTFCRGINGLRSISHPNVLPVVEVSETLFPLCVMTPWMAGGNIIQYTRVNPGANRLMLLAQVCQGLMHLHGLDILHGAIAPNNILITQDGQACLADFGVVGAFRDLMHSDHKLETVRYMAPECLPEVLLHLRIDRLSTKSDIYSLAMTSFEVLTGVLPYDGNNKADVIEDIRHAKRPSRPTDLSQNKWLQDRVWNIITTCWSDKPEQRYELSVVCHVFLTPNTQDALVEFPPVGRENLILLAEELLYTFLMLPLDPGELAVLRKVQEYIFNVISMDGTSPPSFSSAEAAALAETSHELTSILSFPLQPPSLRLWLRLYVHALLLDSQIFPNVELYDEPLDYTPTGFTDIWKGNYHGKPVCIKAIRTKDPIRLTEIRRNFLWSRHISHPNLLPVIEISETLVPFPFPGPLFPLCFMIPWMPDGNITQYTQTNPGANRLMLLAQVCRGLMHLHGLHILHGDIIPNNILITRDGQACLADFGITNAFRDFTSDHYKTENIRYMAPERLPENCILRPRIACLSTESDVYSLAMTSFEVLTGVLPYDGGDEANMINLIRLGRRPSRPTDPSQNQWLHDRVWDMITTCWSDKPEERCELSVVHHVFLMTSLQNVKPDKSAIEIKLQHRGKAFLRFTSLFQSLQDSEPEIERLVNETDKRLENPAMSDSERLKLFNKLCKLCSRHRVIPKSMHIPDCSKDSVEVERGGFADISKGTYQGRRVAIKVVRVYITSDLDVIISGFCREGVAWKHLRHPNVLPLLGVTVSEHRFAMVSEWMEHGNIIEFVGKDKDVNRTELLADVASGLTYMHGLRVVHGDLKGANILINKDRRACLTDFGLSTITGVATYAVAGASRTSFLSNDTLMSFTSGGTRRWMSPELLDPEMFGVPQSEGDRPTRESDCYALGMLIYEVLCGHHPYAEIQSDIMVVNEILEGVRPKKPERAGGLGFSKELWRTVELCWLEDRNIRPGVEYILFSLIDATAFWYKRPRC